MYFNGGGGTTFIRFTSINESYITQYCNITIGLPIQSSDLIVAYCSFLNPEKTSI